MNKLLKRFLSVFAICMVMFSSGAGLASTLNLDGGGDTSLVGEGFSDIIPETNWATPKNRKDLIDNMSNDFTKFAPNTVQLVDDYVPMEAKIGIAMMNGLTRMGEILDMSLMRFAIIFIFIAYAFWLMMETYKMMTEGKGGAMELGTAAVKKLLMISLWFMVLDFGAAKLFMWVMGPIVGVGTYLADFILNAVTGAAGVKLPDTCAAIHQYTIANTPQNMLIDATAAADLMCVPSRMSGFFQTAIAAGWQWMRAGIGNSALTFVTGLVFVILFFFNAWKFAIMAFGIIADLFLGILMLPFTAISECVSKTSYKGTAGNIYNAFAGMFTVESLDAQISRFVNASLYFVSLSIVIGLCTALLSATIDTNIASAVPTIETAGFITTLLTGCLVLYLAMQTDKLVGDLGGKVNTAIGDQINKDINGLWKAIQKQASGWYKAYKGDK